MDSGTPTNEQRFMKTGSDLFVFEEGKKYRIPYHIVKRAVFSNLKSEELIDMQHSARLQYRLMLLDPVIKAIVDFNELRITVIYNSTGAENSRAGMSIEQLNEFLAREGVHAGQGSTENEDYDYYKQFYSYAYSSPTIRESAPYGYTLEEWKSMESAYLKKISKKDKDKLAGFHEWQKAYLKDNPSDLKQADEAQ